MQVELVSLGSSSHPLLLIRVSPDEQVHETNRGECFLQVGDESRHLNFVQHQELLYNRGPSQFDGSEVRAATMSGMDAEQLQIYRTAVGSDAADSTA